MVLWNRGSRGTVDICSRGFYTALGCGQGVGRVGCYTAWGLCVALSGEESPRFKIGVSLDYGGWVMNLVGQG
jgi:hypothetical protein